MSAPPTLRIIVVGSVNLDLVANVSRLPAPGETVSGARLRRFPGGKGANQALAAQRLGASVSLVACVGDDEYAEEALELLRSGEVDLFHCIRLPDVATGIAMISVASNGENQIVVAPGANRELNVEGLTLPAADVLICQLEVPVNALREIARNFDGLFCINLAPACDVPKELIERADLIVVNETEAAYYGASIDDTDGIVVTTMGAQGAIAKKGSEVVAQSNSPVVNVVDTTGAGDTFTAAFALCIARKMPVQEALDFACAAGALATTKQGAQTSLPFLHDVEDCRNQSR